LRPGVGANLIVVKQARAAGIQIGFLEYSLVGAPLTPLTLPAGWVVLILVPA